MTKHLYNELRSRHLYTVGTPTVDDRLESWEGYGALFSFFEEEEQYVSLPNQWMWDIMEEFVYQFQ